MEGFWTFWLVGLRGLPVQEDVESEEFAPLWSNQSKGFHQILQLYTRPFVLICVGLS